MVTINYQNLNIHSFDDTYRYYIISIYISFTVNHLCLRRGSKHRVNYIYAIVNRDFLIQNYIRNDKNANAVVRRWIRLCLELIAIYVLVSAEYKQQNLILINFDKNIDALNSIRFLSVVVCDKRTNMIRCTHGFNELHTEIRTAEQIQSIDQNAMCALSLCLSSFCLWHSHAVHYSIRYNSFNTMHKLLLLLPSNAYVGGKLMAMNIVLLCPLVVYHVSASVCCSKL